MEVERDMDWLKKKEEIWKSILNSSKENISVDAVELDAMQELIICLEEQPNKETHICEIEWLKKEAGLLEQKLADSRKRITDYETRLKNIQAIIAWLKRQPVDETSHSSKVEPNDYTSHEDLIECTKNARHSIEPLYPHQKSMDQKENDVDSEKKDMPENSKKIDETQNKDDIMAESIYKLLLNSYTPDGISVREVKELLERVHEMFECTAIALL